MAYLGIMLHPSLNEEEEKKDDFQIDKHCATGSGRKLYVRMYRTLFLRSISGKFLSGIVEFFLYTQNNSLLHSLQCSVKSLNNIPWCMGLSGLQGLGPKFNSSIECIQYSVQNVNSSLLGYQCFIKPLNYFAIT